MRHLAAAIDWNQIENFLGYGPIDARVVFLGMEEGQSDPDSLAADLAHRSRFGRTMDLKEAHQGIKGTDRYFDPATGTIQRTWRPMCHLMLRRQSADAAPTAHSRLRYQALDLGRADGDTLLVELLPYPKRTADDWPDIYRTRHPTRAVYERAMLPKRIDILSRALRQHSRELIICYGKANWIYYQQVIRMAFGIETRDWAAAVPGWQDVLTAVTGYTRVVLVKHFCCSEFNTEAQLDRLSAAALGQGSAYEVV